MKTIQTVGYYHKSKHCASRIVLGGGIAPAVMENHGTVTAVVIGGTGEKKSNNGTQWYQQDRVYGGGLAMAHPANLPGGSYRYEVSGMEEKKIRIRKLTPKKCWRLMDQPDENFAKAKEVNSDTQLYKQAGNSIVVNVMVGILGQLFEGKEDVYKQYMEIEYPKVSE